MGQHPGQRRRQTSHTVKRTGIYLSMLHVWRSSGFFFCSLFTGIFNKRKAFFLKKLKIYPPVRAYNIFAIHKNNIKTWMEIIGILVYTDMWKGQNRTTCTSTSNGCPQILTSWWSLRHQDTLFSGKSSEYLNFFCDK